MDSMELFQSLAPSLSELLDAATLEQILLKCRQQKYSAGSVLHHRGDDARGFSYIFDGHINFSKVGVEGSRVTTAVLGPGHCFGEMSLFLGLPRNYDISAVDDVTVGTVSESDMRDLIKAYPEITGALLEASLWRMYLTSEFLDSMRLLPLDVRIAKLFRAHVQRSSNTRIRCTQEDIAANFGVSRVSVNKVLSYFEGLGLLKREYRHISIVDTKGLLQWVQERDPMKPLSSMRTEVRSLFDLADEATVSP